MQAIVQEVRLKKPKLKSLYLSSETFINEMVAALQHRSMADFRAKYRNVDVLLIDDVQFIAGKPSTQEEFFHTFNELRENRKQVVVSSDRPPKEIPGLEERLVSRFTWGLVADIQPPDLETRIAILRKKVELDNVSVPTDVIYYIAQQIKTNIRELEGALIRVVAFSSIEDKAVNLQQAQHILKDMVNETTPTITIEMVMQAVSDHFKVSIDELRSQKKTRHIVLPRQIGMYLCRKLTRHSLPEIGNAFGGRDHSTVIHSYNKVTKDVDKELDLKMAVDKLTETLSR
jgi:chromosomal replication initiator protein